MIDRRAGRSDYPKDIIEVVDTADGAWPLSVKDAREDNLWFLRKLSGPHGREPGTGDYGIVDPEDLQPIRLKAYFLVYLSDSPEASLRNYAHNNPDVAKRAQQYLDHLEVQRILKMPDPAERCDKLLPFFLLHQRWNMKSEAHDGIVACGYAAGNKLKEIFDNPQYSQFRPTIILMWRDIRYKEAIPLLIALLKAHDEFWNTQRLQKGWWNLNPGSTETKQRQEVYGEIYYGVAALRSFHDPRTKGILEATRNRWCAIDFDNPQIVEECDAALRELSAGSQP